MLMAHPFLYKWLLVHFPHILRRNNEKVFNAKYLFVHCQFQHPTCNSYKYEG